MPVLLVLIALNALYVAAEFAAVSARRTRVREAAEGGSGAARWALGVLDSSMALDRYVAGCQIGITLSSLLLGAFGQATLTLPLAGVLRDVGDMGQASSVAAASTVVLLGLTGFQVIAGELIPKSVALQFPTGSVIRTAPPMRASLWVFRPLIAVLNGSGIALLRLLGAPAEGHRHIHSPEEISLLIAESHDGGLLSEAEQDRLDRALRLALLPVRRLMIPRTDIVGAEQDWTLARVHQELVDTNLTRLPVYEGTLDRVVGIVHAKEVARRIADGQTGATAREVMRPIAQVPETMRAEQLVSELRRQRSEQAIVIDEHGGVSGLVTLEDLLREVLADPRWRHTGEDAPTSLPDGRVRLPGRLRVDEMDEWVGVPWQGDSDTVGGIVSERLGHIPAEGERLLIAGVDVEVEAVEGVTVKSILVRPVVPEAHE
ncbi:MAG: hemolysin family protein [Dehalococcoidia bacterium]